MAIGNVAPLVQGPSYSDMVEKQIGLINRQREANLAQKLGQDEKNREFRTEQLQNVYDFDVSGLVPGHAKIFDALQKKLSNSLDPSGGDSYANSQELIADINYAKATYGQMKRFADEGRKGQKNYSGYLLGEEIKGDDIEFNGNEESYNILSEGFDGGAFNWDGDIGGERGNRSIRGASIDPSGTESNETDFFESTYITRPDAWFNPPIKESQNWSSYNYYEENAGNIHPDIGGAKSWAGDKFDRFEKVRDRAIKEYERETGMGLVNLEGEGSELDEIKSFFVNRVGKAWKDRFEEDVVKPTASEAKKNSNRADLLGSVSLVEPETSVESEYSLTGPGEEMKIKSKQWNVPLNRLVKDINLTKAVPRADRTEQIDNPDYVVGDLGQPETINQPVDVIGRPTNIVVNDNGTITLKGIQQKGKSAYSKDITLNLDSPQDEEVISQLNQGMLNTYGINLDDLIKNLTGSSVRPQELVNEGGVWSSFNQQ